MLPKMYTKDTQKCRVVCIESKLVYQNNGYCTKVKLKHIQHPLGWKTLSCYEIMI